MKALTKLSTIIILAFLLFGCAISGAKFSEMKNSFGELSPDTGRIIIYRKTVMGAIIRPEVSVNGETVGKAVPRGFFFIDRPAGNYEIKTSPEVERLLFLTLEQGQIRYVRLNLSMGFFKCYIYPELIENEVGESEIQNMRYIGEKSVKNR